MKNSFGNTSKVIISIEFNKLTKENLFKAIIEESIHEKECLEIFREKIFIQYLSRGYLNIDRNIREKYDILVIVCLNSLSFNCLMKNKKQSFLVQVLQNEREKIESSRNIKKICIDQEGSTIFGRVLETGQ